MISARTASILFIFCAIIYLIFIPDVFTSTIGFFFSIFLAILFLITHKLDCILKELKNGR